MIVEQVPELGPNLVSDVLAESDLRTHADSPDKRIRQMLSHVEHLGRQLEVDETYKTPTLDYELPASFLLSVVIPVYNEKDTICTTIARVRALPFPTQIIVVDDFSSDGTRTLLEEIAKIEGVRVVFKPQNQGKGAALRTGFTYARGSVVAVQDADLEYDPRDLVPMIRPIVEDSADVVYGSRFASHRKIGSSWLHQFGNRVLTVASNLFTGLCLTDMETCYKVFRRSVLKNIDLRQDRFGFEPEFTAKIARQRYRVLELPIGYNPRSWDAGKKIGFRDGLNALYCIVRYGLSD